MCESSAMETSDIVQIVGLGMTVLGFIASEILAVCPGTRANGLLHWLTLLFNDNRDIQITIPHQNATYELRRRPSIHGERPSIAVSPPTSSPPPTPTPSRDLDYYSQTTLENDVSRPNSEAGEETSVPRL